MDSSIDDSIPNPESSRLFDDDDPIDAELHKRKASEIVDEDELGGPSKSQKLTATLNEKIYAPSSIHRFQEAPIPPEQCATLPKDSSYYFEDGNVILLVYDTYFKVHQSRLSQDSSIFSSMFTLPQCGAETDGSSQERPIRILEKPRRFAALMWALYALPAELRHISDNADNVIRLVDIATAAKKYQFKTTEEWALTCLTDLVRTSNQIHQKKINPWRIFGLASLCDSAELRNAMVLKIKERAAAGKLPYSWVATIAEALDIKELLGEAYYRLVVKGQDRWNEDRKLTEPMIQKLYVGFCRIVSFRDKLFQSPLPIGHHECLGAGQCRARWLVVWKDCLQEVAHSARLPSVDLLGQLLAFVQYMRRNRQFPGPCHEAWCQSIEAKVQEISDGGKLVEFFKPMFEETAEATTTTAT